MKRPCVYILTNRPNGVLYIGATTDLARRVWDHKSGAISGFTRRYKTHHLVYAEYHDTIDAAFQRERRMKKWRRVWKIDLIEAQNPHWHDLYDDLLI